MLKMQVCAELEGRDSSNGHYLLIVILFENPLLQQNGKIFL